MNRKKKIIIFIVIPLVLVIGGLVGNYFRPVKRKVRHYERGRIFLQKARYTAAIIQFEKALAISPSTEISYLIATANFLDGDTDKAILVLQRIMQNESMFTKSYFLLLDCYNKQKKYDKSLEISKAFLTRFPDDIKMLNHQGNILAALEKQSEAELLFKKIIASNPQNDLAYINLAFLYWRMSKKDIAVEVIEKYLESFPENKNIRAPLGDFYFRMGEYLKATEQYKNIEGTEFFTPSIQQNYAMVLVEIGQITKATEVAEEALKKNLSKEQTFAMRYITGVGQLFKKDYKKAIEEFLWVSSFAPDFAIARYQLGIAYALDKNYLLAGYELQKAIELDPNLNNMQNVVLQIYSQDKKWDEALNMCDEILKKIPDSVPVFNLKARFLILAGQIDEAQKIYREIGGSSGVIGQVLADLPQKNYEAAIAKLRKALIAYPEDKVLRYLLAQIYFEQRDIEKSLHYLNLVPDYPASLRMIAEIRLIQGNTNLAIEAYQKLLALFPRNDQICLQLANLYASTKQLQKALDILHENKKTPGMHIMYRQAYGQIYFLQKKYDKALQVLQEFSDKHPNLEMLKGDIYVYLKKYPLAIISYQNVEEVSQIDTKNKIAFCLYMQNNTTEALNYMEKYLEKTPRQMPWHFFHALLLMSQQLFPETLRAIETISQHPQKTEKTEIIANILRSCLYLQQNDIDKSLQEIENIPVKQKFIREKFTELIHICNKNKTNFLPLLQAMCSESLNVSSDHVIAEYEKAKQNISSTLVDYHYALYLYKTAQTKEAEQKFLAMAENDDLTFEAYQMLTSVYARTKEIEKLKNCYEKCLQMEENYIPALIGLGVYYEAQKNVDKAISYYNNILHLATKMEIDKTSQMIALNNLSYIYVTVKSDKQKALEYAKKAFELSPYRWEVVDTLGYAYYCNEEYKNALRYFTYAHNLSPLSPDILYHLALVYVKAKRKKDALVCLEKAFLSTANKSIVFLQKDNAKKLLAKLQRK